MFPINNPIINKLRDKYWPDKGYSYDEVGSLIENDLQKQVQVLEQQKTKTLTINPGDWVSLTREYAVDHGRDNLKEFVIRARTVYAGDLYTEGNSIHEWGWDPS